MSYIDTIRLDRLSDPTFKFSYDIRADRKLTVRAPMTGVFNDLRSGIDYARCVLGETPFCIKCKTVLSEDNQCASRRGKTRFLCPNCDTEFSFGT